MVQAVLQILVSFRLPLSIFLSLVSLLEVSPQIPELNTVVYILHGLRSQVALGRRFFRIFRFLDSFHGAWTLYNESGERFQTRNGEKPAEVWLDICGRTFNGMYLILETSTLLDALGVEGLAPWGSVLERQLNVEGQRFWFFALVCGVLSALVRLVKLMAYAPVPETGEGFGDGRPGVSGAADGEAKNLASQMGGKTVNIADAQNEKVAPRKDQNEAQSSGWEQERDRLRRVVQSRREQRKRWRLNVKRQSRGILRRLLADIMDL
jgi:hypothetical protein